MVVSTLEDQQRHMTSHTYLRSGPSAVSTAAVAGGGLEGLNEETARRVDECLNEDIAVADLVNKIGLQRIDEPTVSGLQDDDYPDYASLGLAELEELIPVKRSPIPPELIDQFTRMQTSFAMGLIPAISRAWVSIDSDFYAWNYETGADLAFYDGLNHTIVQAGFAKPKKGVFKSSVHSILLVATSVEIALLVASFGDVDLDESESPGSADMHLMPEPMFKVPTDGAVVTSFASTPEGRIFFSAVDGCLYEIDYQDRGWLGKSCKKINHSKGLFSYFVPSLVSATFGENEPLVQVTFDQSRKLLYTRSEFGSIAVYDLGPDGKSISKVGGMSAGDIQHRAENLFSKSIEPSNFKPVVHMAPVTQLESSIITLIAVSGSGVRFYFTCFSGLTKEGVWTAPESFHLVHVRLPPGFSAGSYVARPQRVHSAHISTDTCLMLSMANEEDDLLWGLNSAHFPFYSRLIEAPKQFHVSGRTWALCAANDHRSPPPNAFVGPPLLARQQFTPSRRFIILTPQGLHFYTNHRPVDALARLLRRFGPESPVVKAYFKLIKPTEACAMCLLLVCSGNPDPQLSELATRAFFLYGGEPHFTFVEDATRLDRTQYPQHQETIATPGAKGIAPPRITSTPFPSLQGIAATPSTSSMTRNTTIMNGTTGMMEGGRTEIRFSRRHDALTKYIARLLSSFWDTLIAVPAGDDQPLLPDGQKRMLSPTKTKLLVEVIHQLGKLREWITRTGMIDNIAALDRTVGDGLGDMQGSMMNAILREASATPGMNPQQIVKKYKDEALHAEKQSLLRLQEFLIRSLEVFRLWKIVMDHQFSAIVHRLPPNVQEHMKQFTFRNLIVFGNELCGDLCTAIVSQYLGDNASVDSISERLRDVCPNLFTNDDATAAKAGEVLEMAQSMEPGANKDVALAQALRLFQQVTGSVNLPAIVAQFENVLYYTGIVDLCLSAANKSDPQNLGIRCYADRDLMDADPEAARAFENRMACYRSIADALSHLVNPDRLRDTRVSSDWIDQTSEEMLAMCLRSNDELCHVTVFDWLMEKRLSQKLLETDSMYLEPYLQGRAASGSGLDSGQYMEILYKYYERKGMYLKAAKLLAKLAERHGTHINLSQRLDYISRAVLCAKSCDPVPAQGSFLQELEDKLEVASLQKRILHTLQHQNRSQHDIYEVVSKLNADLFDITRLYQDFCEEFDLAECKLAILHCSNFSGEQYIESVWREIIDYELSLADSENTDAKMQILEEKLEELSKKYKNTRYIPMKYLAKYLCVKAYSEQFPASWPPSTSLKMGVEFDSILEIYTGMYKLKEPIWSADRRGQLFLTELLLNLFDVMVENPGLAQASPVERRKTVNKCLDVIAGCLVDLQTQTHSRGLILRFQNVQNRIERLP